VCFHCPPAIDVEMKTMGPSMVNQSNVVVNRHSVSIVELRQKTKQFCIGIAHKTSFCLSVSSSNVISRLSTKSVVKLYTSLSSSSFNGIFKINLDKLKRQQAEF